MQTNYNFISEHAKQYGISQAVVLHTIIYFVLRNKKYKRNEIAGRYWVFNSSNQWQYFFPFLSKHQIYRCFKDLTKKEAILEDSFNKMGYDRTLWHTLSDALLNDCIRDSYWKNRVTKMQEPVANVQKSHCKSATPIPYIYTTDNIDVLDGIEPY
jgi:hypothetical protein